MRWVGGALAAVGFALLFVGLVRSGLIQLVGAELGASPVGAGPFLGALLGLLSVFQFEHLTTMLKLSLSQAELGNALMWNLAPGLVLWVAGWGALSFGLGSEAVAEAAPSEAVGRPLFPRLANARDFNWGTLAAYGFGVLFAELAFIGAYMVLVGTATTPGSEVRSGMSPIWAFVIAFFLSLLIAFSGGFGGASNAQRLATPEATIALIYFGMPVPLLLSAMHHVPELMTSLGYRLREVVYLSSLLGETRPELGYWLVFAGIALALFLGINFGFVSTGSGKLDLRASYELFISARHVSVFRPRLLLGAFTVLILGIVPPLIIYAIVAAAEAAAERTRIRRLGMKDPLEAARALHELKLKAQTPTAMMTALSVGGVGVGVMALIIVLSVMSGFEADLQKKILGTNAHGVVMKFSLEMPEYDEVMEKLGGVRGIVGRTPFILNEVMIAAEGNISGSMIKGIDPKTVGSVTDLPEYMLPGGSLEGLNDPTTIKHKSLTKSLKDAALDERPAELKKDDILRDPMIEVAEDGAAAVLPGLVLGRELAASLKVVVGDAIQVVSPIGGELGPQGPTPKSRAFRVAGIFYSGMYEYDSKFVYIRPQARPSRLLQREGRERHRGQGRPTSTTRAASMKRRLRLARRLSRTAPRTGAR